MLVLPNTCKKYKQMAFHTLLSTLKEKISSRRELKKHELIIRRSNMFDEGFYVENYPQIGSEGTKNPVKHYLLKGAALGHDPAKWFSTSWYIEQYEDVNENQFNPFIHYILYGRREGRKPNPDSNQFTSIVEMQIDELKNGVIENLWGGYSSPALKKLETIYVDVSADLDLRFFAAWHAARWYYYVEDFDTALDIAELVRSFSTKYHLDKTFVLMYSFCLMKLGDFDKAKIHLSKYLVSAPEDADILLSMANLFNNPDERLACINKAYTQNGFLPIYAKSESSKLRFETLVSKAPKVKDERLVSVIIPTFNAGERLSIAIQSLLNQSWQNIEIIVVDDCSTDDTSELVRQLSASDERVKFIQQNENGGAYKARNAGLQIANGDFITTHDSDDWSHPQKIESQVAYLDLNPTVIGVSTHWVRATGELNFQHNWRLNPRLIHWSHSSFLFRKVVLKELGSWDNVIAGGDTEFIWRVQARFGYWAFRKIHKEVPLAFALDDDSSLTRNKSTHIRTMHNGMRHVYRSSCQWWHKTSSENLLLGSGVARKFPAPKSMVVRGDNNSRAELLLISDFSQHRFKNCEIEMIQKLIKEGLQIVLYHIPEYGKLTKPLCDHFFELLMNENVGVCVHGMKVTSKYVVFLNHNILSYVPEQLAEISSEEVFVESQKGEQPTLENIKFFVSEEAVTRVTTFERVELQSILTNLFSTRATKEIK
ncbi:glycosyltransferase [Alteromonas macleodii]|uniref:glycosyltransferase n=1 Tax=Alteromonas macleodii TaxID=28108 RepID=UPI003BF7E5A4